MTEVRGRRTEEREDRDRMTEKQRSEGKGRRTEVGGRRTEDLFNRGLCLPSGTAMTSSDLDRVIDVILKCKRA